MIVLHIELQMGKDKDKKKKKEWVIEYGITTACTLRLAKHWAGKGKIIVGDSWFGSVKSACALKCELGLDSVLMVKTSHKRFPKQYLDGKKNFSDLNWVSVSSEYKTNGQTVNIMATRSKDL